MKALEIDRVLRAAPLGESEVFGMGLKKTKGSVGDKWQHLYLLEGREKPCDLRWAVHNIQKILKERDED
jgi:hypothetical protein